VMLCQLSSPLCFVTRLLCCCRVFVLKILSLISVNRYDIFIHVLSHAGSYSFVVNTSIQQCF